MTIPESLLNWQDKLTWSDNRKLQTKLARHVEQMKKGVKGDKTPLSPLGQRPSLDAEHLPMPKPKDPTS